MPRAAPHSSDHLPVLPEAAVTALVTLKMGTYVDATFGRGGHARRILQQLAPSGHLIALDRDPAAAQAATAITDTRFTFERTRFSQIASTLALRGIAQVQGVLLDLG